MDDIKNVINNYIETLSYDELLVLQNKINLMTKIYEENGYSYTSIEFLNKLLTPLQTFLNSIGYIKGTRRNDGICNKVKEKTNQTMKYVENKEGLMENLENRPYMFEFIALSKEEIQSIRTLGSASIDHIENELNKYDLELGTNFKAEDYKKIFSYVKNGGNLRLSISEDHKNKTR